MSSWALQYNSAIGALDELLEGVFPRLFPPGGPLGAPTVGIIVGGTGMLVTGLTNVVSGLGNSLITSSPAGLPQACAGAVAAGVGGMFIGAGIMDVIEDWDNTDYRSPLHIIVRKIIELF